MKRHYDLVEITWVDASDMESGWTSKIEVTPAMARSSGYLVYQDEEHIVLAQDNDGDGEHNGRGQIPAGMVKNIEVLKKKDA
jgi:hypothetical protein